LDFVQHVDGKCLFEPTDYVPGKMKTERKTVKAAVTEKPEVAPSEPKDD
jgi:hypothetical protein